MKVALACPMQTELVEGCMGDTPLFDAEQTLEDPSTTRRRRPRYELLERIGSGGMAAVYRARQRTVCGFDRLVALKQIASDRSTDPNFVDWFIREAKIASALSHPNVVQIYDFGRNADQYFIAMEYVEGHSLQELARLAARAGDPIPVEVVLAIAGELCDALDHIHDRVGVDGAPLEIVHRDVSLANLIVTHSGHLKLIDFGIASARTAPWSPKVFAGKLAYAAPETIRGEKIDARADIFAAGIVLWQLLCGCPLFASDDDAATVNNVLRAEVPPPSTRRPDCPPDLDRIVLAMLARDRDQRPRAGALRAMVDDVIDTRRLSVTPSSVARWLVRLTAPTPPSIQSEPMREVEPEPVAACVPKSTVASWRPSSQVWQPRRKASMLTRFAVAATIVVGWFAVSALATPAPPVSSTSTIMTTLPSVDRTRVAMSDDATAVAAVPLVQPDAAPIDPPLHQSRRASVHQHVARTKPPKPDVQVAVKSDASELASDDDVTVPAAAPTVATSPLPVLPVAAPTQSGPITIPPDRVRQLSGAALDLDLERIERDGMSHRIVTVLCIDGKGKVTSVRFLGKVPEWAQQALAPQLQHFTFTPYVIDATTREACFTRNLKIARG